MRQVPIGVAVVAILGCATSSLAPPAVERARALADRLLIVDTHIDVPYRLIENYEDVTQATESGDFDYPRAVAGGLDVAFMSIYVPPVKEDDGTATAFAHELIDGVERIAAAAPDRFTMVATTAEARRAAADNRIGLALGMENGAPIAGDLANLERFYARGIRYITLAHGKSNHISDSSYDDARPWGGLSPFGRELVAAMNRTGVMIDVSHLSDEAFYDVLEVTETPVIASHSSLRHFTPGWERNMSDEMVRALAANGGVVQINFGSSFVSEASYRSYLALKGARDAFVDEHDFDPDGPERKAFDAGFRAAIPYTFATLDDVLDHFDRVRDLVGVEHVGIGSDFDGVGDSLPIGLKDVSAYPNLLAGLLERGYSEEQIALIAGGNLVRVWNAVEDYAAKD